MSISIFNHSRGAEECRILKSYSWNVKAKKGNTGLCRRKRKHDATGVGARRGHFSHREKERQRKAGCNKAGLGLSNDVKDCAMGKEQSSK